MNEGKLPAPERPVGKGNVEMMVGGAVAEDWRGRPRWSVVLGPADGGLVHAIKHEIDIRDPPWVPAEELQEAPDREHGSALDTGIVEIRVEAATGNDDTESRIFASFHEIGDGNAGMGPWGQVMVDPAEERRARRWR